MDDGLMTDDWTELLRSVKTRGETDVAAVVDALARRFDAHAALVDGSGVVGDSSLPDDMTEQFTSVAGSDDDELVAGEGEASETFRIARGPLATVDAVLVLARAGTGFSDTERSQVTTFAHVLDLGLSTAERRRERSAGRTLDEVFGASDTLTGLLTRDSFKEYLEASLSGGDDPDSVLVIGLDGFRIANDTLGYATGDVVLQTVASRIQTCVRDGDVASRIGGDIFAVYSPGIGSDLAADVAGRIQNSISQRIPVGESDLIITASVGVATAADTDDADSVLANADTAMRSAKNLGQGVVDFYDEELRHSVQRRRSLAAELQDAILENQLATVLEPIVSTSDLSVVGHEARVTWQHPTRGRLESESFMPLAVDIGRVADVERAVFTFAIQEHFRDPQLAPTSINLSTSSLLDARHIEWMIDQLEMMNIPGESIIVEIAETAMTNNFATATEHLGRLREAGVGVVLDDFGSANASIRSFHDFPFDGVKLHPSLLAGTSEFQTKSILKSLYTSADVLGFDVIHVSIDTDHQLTALEAFGDQLERETLFAQGAAVRDRVIS